MENENGLKEIEERTRVVDLEKRKWKNGGRKIKRNLKNIERKFKKKKRRNTVLGYGKNGQREEKMIEKSH